MLFANILELLLYTFKLGLLVPSSSYTYVVVMVKQWFSIISTPIELSEE